MSLFTKPSSLSDIHLPQFFNLQQEQADSISITSENDGLYVSIKLARKKHPCLACVCKRKMIKEYSS